MKKAATSPTALTLLPRPSLTEQRKRPTIHPRISDKDAFIAVSKARKSIREEAQLLRRTAKILLAVGLLGEFALCAANPLAGKLCEMIQVALYGWSDPMLCTISALVICIIGLLWATACIMLASLMFGVARTLNAECKKLNLSPSHRLEVL